MCIKTSTLYNNTNHPIFQLEFSCNFIKKIIDFDNKKVYNIHIINSKAELRYKIEKVFI